MSCLQTFFPLFSHPHIAVMGEQLLIRAKSDYIGSYSSIATNCVAFICYARVVTNSPHFTIFHEINCANIGILLCTRLILATSFSHEINLKFPGVYPTKIFLQKRLLFPVFRNPGF